MKRSVVISSKDIASDPTIRLDAKYWIGKKMNQNDALILELIEIARLLYNSSCHHLPIRTALGKVYDIIYDLINDPTLSREWLTDNIMRFVNEEFTLEETLQIIKGRPKKK